jgi:hypothetical protein
MHAHINSPKHTPLISTLKIAAAYSVTCVYVLSTVFGVRKGKVNILVKEFLINITLVLIV